MRGLSAEPSPSTHQAGTNAFETHTNGNGRSTPLESHKTEPERPDIEELTPPPVESLTPPQSSAQTPFQTSPPASLVSQVPQYASQPPLAVPQAGSDLLSSLSMPPVRHYAGSPGSAGGVTKKRKLEDETDGFGVGEDAMADLDDDVAELLRAESGGY